MGRALHPLIAEEGGRTLFLDVVIECGQLIVDPEVGRGFTVVLGCLAAPHLQSATVGEPLELQGVIPVLLAKPGRERLDFRHVTDHGFNVLFHEQLGIPIGGLPNQSVSLLVLQQVSGHTEQHLGVTNPRRLDEVDLSDVVIGHRVDDGHLERERLPAPLLIGGLHRQVVMVIHPLGGGLHRRPEQG